MQLLPARAYRAIGCLIALTSICTIGCNALQPWFVLRADGGRSPGRIGIFAVPEPTSTPKGLSVVVLHEAGDGGPSMTEGNLQCFGYDESDGAGTAAVSSRVWQLGPREFAAARQRSRDPQALAFWLPFETPLADGARGLTLVTCQQTSSGRRIVDRQYISFERPSSSYQRFTTAVRLAEPPIANANASTKCPPTGASDVVEK